jgi:hypothetical protein
MTPTHSDDYILRQIQVAEQRLARAIGWRMEGRHEEARAIALAETAARQFPDDEDLARTVREISPH